MARLWGCRVEERTSEGGPAGWGWGGVGGPAPRAPLTSAHLRSAGLPAPAPRVAAGKFPKPGRREAPPPLPPSATRASGGGLAWSGGAAAAAAAEGNSKSRLRRRLLPSRRRLLRPLPRRGTVAGGAQGGSREGPRPARRLPPPSPPPSACLPPTCKPLPAPPAEAPVWVPTAAPRSPGAWGAGAGWGALTRAGPGLGEVCTRESLLAPLLPAAEAKGHMRTEPGLQGHLLLPQGKGPAEGTVSAPTPCALLHCPPSHTRFWQITASELWCLDRVGPGRRGRGGRGSVCPKGHGLPIKGLSLSFCQSGSQRRLCPCHRDGN